MVKPVRRIDKSFRGQTSKRKDFLHRVSLPVLCQGGGGEIMKWGEGNAERGGVHFSTMNLR